jgi:hypothetical protein
MSQRPETIDRIGDAVDMRIAQLWAMAFEYGLENMTAEFFGLLLRTAYMSGYSDALTEPERGQLMTELGYPVPRRATR